MVNFFGWEFNFPKDLTTGDEYGETPKRPAGKGITDKTQKPVTKQKNQRCKVPEKPERKQVR